MSRLLLILVTACAVLAAVAVGGASGSTATTRATPAFPVSVTAANGKVTIGRAPRRIVSLSATATESLFAIGAGAQVVAALWTSTGIPRRPSASTRPFGSYAAITRSGR